MKLYYTPAACSLADHIALAEAGLPYDLVKVDLKAKKTGDGRDFTTINPKGYVPVLELDDGETLTENVAVLSYIGSRAPKLMPATGLPHWRVLETTAFVSTELHKNFKPFFSPSASDAEKEEARDLLVRRFQFLETKLGDGAFIEGEQMSIADCYLFVMLRWARKNKVKFPKMLAAYFDRMNARPSVVRALKEEGLG